MHQADLHGELGGQSAATCRECHELAEKSMGTSIFLVRISFMTLPYSLL